MIISDTNEKADINIPIYAIKYLIFLELVPILTF